MLNSSPRWTSKTHTTEGRYEDWLDIIRALEVAFGEVDPGYSWDKRLLNMQQGSRPFADYINDFRTVSQRVDFGGRGLIRIRAGDEWKTAFRRYGHFEYDVMPFGLTNAPATFQAYINRALADMLDDLCVVYLDDILIYTHSDNIEEHWAAVRKVLERLRRAELFCNLKKRTFASPQVAYRVTRDGVAADPDKVATIREWPAPKNLKELQTFLGFANFYRTFVENYSKVIQPLTALLKKNAEYRWGSEAEKAFQNLKDRFTSTPTLGHFDPKKQVKLGTDAACFVCLVPFAALALRPGASGRGRG